MRTLNVRLAIVLLVGAVVLSGVVYAVHAWQVTAHAGVFLEAAKRAKDEKEYKEARQNYLWFVNLAHGTPAATDALQDLATMIADQSTDPQGAAGALRYFEDLFARIRRGRSRGGGW